LSAAHCVVMVHKDKSMVTSGSFYHALTFGCNVLASESAFTSHKAKQHDFIHLVNFVGLDEQTLANIWIEKKIFYLVFCPFMVVNLWNIVGNLY
jgi:beta-1,4-mannosyltransferase